MRRAVTATITGRVQGVGYRDWTRREALARGLSGWVRNRRDGTVEGVLAGDDATVESLLTALRSGPPAARVTAVAVDEWSGEVPQGFEVWDTK